MADAWTLAVALDDLAATTLLTSPAPEADAGQAVLRVDRVGVTANNVTYGLLGRAFRYWEFFPTGPGLGLVPLWGFADVVASRADGVEVGSRVYGYLPPASHLVVRPGGVDGRRFRDAAEHRRDLPSPYNVYLLTTGDEAYREDLEDLQVLYRPLFFTSFMLADQLEDLAWHGAEVLALSSASSKTAYGTAFLLRGRGPEVLGLTSAAHVAFTESLGCYDRVLAYEDLSLLRPDRPTAYLDVSGRAEVRAALRRHLGRRLVHDTVVGLTSQERTGAMTLEGPRPAMFFAPDQMRKRTGDWGREVLDRRFAEAWARFVPAAVAWVDVVEHHGPDALREVWLEVLAGRAAPRTGHVVSL